MPTTKQTVILLEDDRTLLSILADGLQHEGHVVIAAPTTAEAALALEQFGGAAVLVADRSVDVAGRNGFQFAAEALTRFPALRVVYISGTHLAIRKRALGAREQALMKPFSMSQLLGCMRKLP